MTTYHQTRALTKLSSSNKRPPRYKLFLLTWLAIYPLITLILYFFKQPLSLLPLPIRTLVLTGALVYLMTYWVMPMLMKLFHSWLYLK
jgi:antibiotic biosynthesis monooxygenase (ABM) superfamily enzyme